MEWGSDARREPCELVNLCSQDLSPGDHYLTRCEQYGSFPISLRDKVHMVHKVHNHKISLWIGLFRVNLNREPWAKGSRRQNGISGAR
jgi:hypothetical protein